jgi:hypothetical protein
MEPRLVVVIDTEEDWFDEWDRPTTVENVQVLPEVQARTFDPLGIKPTYMVTYPVATDPRCAAIFREFVDSDVCEVGTHVHNWTSPPFTDQDRRHRTYHCSIEPELEREKIEDLTGILEERIGTRPLTFKGGRWGASGQTIRNIETLGYTTDTSVCPVTDFRPYQGGPDYTDAPFDCYFPRRDDILRVDEEADADRAVLEIPVSVGFAKPDFENQLRLWKRIHGSPALKRFKAVGLLDRLGVMRRIKLSPEQAGIEAMRRLVDATIERGHRVINLTFHSCILALGCSPYSMTARDLDQGIRRLSGILDYIVNDRGIRPLTCRELRAEFRRTPVS